MSNLSAVTQEPIGSVSQLSEFCSEFDLLRSAVPPAVKHPKPESPRVGIDPPEWPRAMTETDGFLKVGTGGQGQSRAGNRVGPTRKRDEGIQQDI